MKQQKIALYGWLLFDRLEIVTTSWVCVTRIACIKLCSPKWLFTPFKHCWFVLRTGGDSPLLGPAVRVSKKKLSTTKLHNFSKIYNFCFWSFLHLRSFENFWISNVRNSNIIFIHRWFQMKCCQLKSCITFQDLQLAFWSFLHPMSFKNLNLLCSSIRGG
jgi:hypothetical protein